MKLGLAVVALAAGCSAARTPPSTAAPPIAHRALPVAPAVVPAGALAHESRVPPLIVLVNADGELAIAAAPARWEELAHLDVSGARPVPSVVRLEDLLRAAQEHGWSAAQTVDHLASLPSHVQWSQEDPPPPEPGDAPDARAAHVAAAGGFGPHFGYDATRTGWGVIGNPGPYPTRAAELIGEVAEDARLPATTRVLVIADPHARATALIAALKATSGAIAVEHGGAIGALRLGFATESPSIAREPRWMELRASAGKLVLEAVPGVPVAVDPGLDPAALRAELDTLRARRKLDAWTAVDVLADPQLDAQHLVDLLVALDQAGIHAIGLGKLPDASELALRGRRMRSLIIGSIQVDADADRGPLRHALAGQPALAACYETALAAHPELAGVVTVSFTYGAHGEVTDASASGVDPALARCFADAIRHTAFRRRTAGTGTVKVTSSIELAPDRVPP